MKILFIGDITRVRLRRWVSYLVERGYEIQVLSSRKDKVDNVELVYKDDGENAKSKFERVIKRFLFAFFVWRYVKKHKFDIVHMQYLRADWSSFAATRHKKAIISVWGKEVLPFTGSGGEKLWLCKQLALGRAALVTTVHHFIENRIREWVPKVKRVEIIPFGADMKRFGRLKRIGSGQNNMRFCYVRPLEAEYYPELILKVFAKLSKKFKNMTLVMIGAGEKEYVESLQKFIESEGLSKRVLIVSKISDIEFNHILERCDALVDLSKWDTWGVVILEAMAAGLPVIALQTAGVPDVVIDKITGFTVPENDEASLIEAMTNMLTNRQLLDQMSRNSREMANKLYSFTMHAEQMEAIYQLVHTGNLKSFMKGK